MRQTIRFQTFETNSSSTHSCVICTDEELTKWENGEVFVDWSGNFYTREELEDERSKDTDPCDTFEDWLREADYYSLDNWGDPDRFEGDTTTREINGVKYHAVCYYGYDG